MYIADYYLKQKHIHTVHVIPIISKSSKMGNDSSKVDPTISKETFLTNKSFNKYNFGLLQATGERKNRINN